MLPSQSREHRLRVLENQTRLAAERVAPVERGADLQMSMSLIVEVKSPPRAQRRRRPRSKAKTEQPGLEDI